MFKDVPAEVCENCGEAFYSEEATRALLAQAEDTARAGVEVDVWRYARCVMPNRLHRTVG